MSTKRWGSLRPILMLVFTLFWPAVTVKHENFKTCDQSGFCKRNRAFADTADSLGEKWTSPYTISPESVKVKHGVLSGTLSKYLGQDVPSVDLDFSVYFLEQGVARIMVDEPQRRKGDIELRHGSQARKERYDEVADWALVGQQKPDPGVEIKTSNKETLISYGPSKGYKAVIKHKPFAIDFIRNDQVQIKFNGKGLMNVEHWRPKVEKEAPKEGEEPKDGVESAKAGEDESTWWEETFGGNTDSKPRGPESVGLDITFPGYEHVFGIPGHASSLSLKETRGASGGYSEPYRLHNSDVFEYEMDSPMTLYGAIPFMQAHRKGSTVGVFWMNAAETWVDIVKRKINSNPYSMVVGGQVDTETHWFSETGLIEIFVFLGPEPKDVIRQYSELTGYTTLPQLSSIAYHQCRWNYVTDEDVKDVDKKFDKYRIPYDIIWLDIEYTDGKKYFTWDSHTFPDPIGMQKQLDSHDRKLVIIIDPHIKNEVGYSVVDELKSKDLAVHNKDNTIYEGWCWPGSSHWVDCFNPVARSWWTSLFAYKTFTGTASNTHLWNDMNEPSVFNGPETTMPKDNLHYGNWEHRDLHNVNGMTFVNATYHALLARETPPKRPFVLTRSFYSGSQRLGAMWTGDNQAVWPHLAASIPMLLTQNIAGFPFSGADVGGFFGNPSKELLTRWYQAGAFYPFMRGHAHIDTRRREPYLAGEPYTSIITQALRLRYALLPAWYTAFHEASISGAPILRPHYYVHPTDPMGFALEDQFYLGGTGLLVKPVVTEGATSVDIYLPPNEIYYDYFTYKTYTGTGASINIHAPLEKIPILMREGGIIPRKDRPRRSSGLMKWDPYTIIIILDKEGKAQGELYSDDGESFDYQSGAFIHRNLTFSSNTLTSSVANTAETRTIYSLGKVSKATRKYLDTMRDIRVEKIIVVNAPRSLEGKREVSVVNDEGVDRKVGLTFHKGQSGQASWAVVRDPGAKVGEAWSVAF